MARYEKSLSPPIVLQRKKKRFRGAPRTGGSRRGRWFISFVLLALVIAAAYIYDYCGPAAETRPTGLRTSGDTEAPPVLPVRTSAQPPPEKREAPAEKRKRFPRRRSQRLNLGDILKLKVNQDCWLNITIDDTVSQQYNLKAGDLIEWKGEKAFALDLGNPGGVEAELNGKPLKPLGERGKPVHVTLKAAGVSQLGRSGGEAL